MARAVQKPAVPEVELYAVLLRTAAGLQAPLEQLFKAHGVTDAQYNVLRILRGAGPPGLPCLRIGERLIQRVPDVTRLVDRLESAGLVARSRPAEDRRVVLVSLTARGRELLGRLDGPVLAVHRKSLSHLSRKEVETLARLLEKTRAGA